MEEPGRNVAMETEKLTKLLEFLERSSFTFTDKKQDQDDEDDVKVRRRHSPVYPPPEVTYYDIKTWRRKRHNLAKEYQLYGINSGFGVEKRRIIGGNPITLETAMELREVTTGSSLYPVRAEWRRSAILFQYIESCFPYGLQINDDVSGGMLLCVQTFILKHLLFAGDAQRGNRLLDIRDEDRKSALIEAMVEILWRAGENRKCFVCLKGEETGFPRHYNYRTDGVTEKLRLFEFNTPTEVRGFLKRHLEEFENSPGSGSLLFLYSLILSRTTSRVKKDMGVVNEEACLLTANHSCSPALINLLLTGRAVKFYHNGDQLFDDDGEILTRPLRGIMGRNSIGFLHWNRRERQGCRTRVGSRLTTPKYPIWLIDVNNQFAVIFSTKIELVKDWRTEKNFRLYYYTGLSNVRKPTILSVDTTRDDVMTSWLPGVVKDTTTSHMTSLVRCLSTKWYGAKITVQ